MKEPAKRPEYPTDKNRPWNEIPLGAGVEWDVSMAPHMLIGGPTGSGKSSLQRNIFLHVKQRPDEWEFYGIDLKRVELKPYTQYTDVVKKIATNVEESTELLHDLCTELEERYRKMEDTKANSFRSLPDSPKAIILMVDEIFPLFTPAIIESEDDEKINELQRKAYQYIQHLTILGRAAGIHLVVGTQRITNKITGDMANGFDARVACGRMSAEMSHMLLGNDSATYLPPSPQGQAIFQEYGVEDNEVAFPMYFVRQDDVDNY